MPALVDEIISKTRRNQEGQGKRLLDPVRNVMDPVKGSIFDGNTELLGSLIKAIMDGNLSDFLAQNPIGSDDYAAIENVIDVLTAKPDTSRQDRLKREADGITIDATQAEALKTQLAEHASGVSTASEGRIGVPMKTSKEYSSPLALYREMVAKATKKNDNTAPPGTPTFEQWLSINGLTSNQVVPSGASVTLGAYKTYVGRAGETLRSIAEKGGYDVAELAKINGVTDLDALVAGAELFLPPPKETSTGGIGEQTMPTDTTTDPSTDPGTADPNNPGSTDTPGGGGLQPGELEKGDPWLNSLYEDSFGTDKLGRLIDELITNKDYTPGTSSRYERLLRKNAGLLGFGLQMDPASADTGMGTAIAGLMDQIRGGQGIDAWSLINQAAGGDPEYKASFEGSGFDPSNVASILALARSGMVPDEALRSLYQGDYITGLYNDWERTNQGQGDMGTFLAYLMSKGL